MAKKKKTKIVKPEAEPKSETAASADYDKGTLVDTFLSDSTWKSKAFYTDKSRWPVWASVIVITVFSLMFWWLNISKHNNEPMDLTAIYRIYDYGYYPAIQRYFQAMGGEYFSLESEGKGSIVMPYAGLAPYSLIQFFVGSWTYMFGDLFSNLFRFISIWLLLGFFAKSREERAWLSLAFFFISSEMVLGNFTATGIFKGAWGMRIPRNIVTSSYFFLSLWALTKIKSHLNGKIDIKKLIVFAIPLCFLINGDLYTGISVSLTYLLLFLYWYSQGKISLIHCLSYAGAGIIVCLPMFYLFSTSSELTIERLGRYPMKDLYIGSLPLKNHLIFLLASFFCISLGRRHFPQLIPWKVPLYATAILGFSFIASLIFSALTGFNIQEYQYFYRMGQISGLLLAIWAVVLFSFVCSQLKLSSNGRSIAAFVLAATVGFLGFQNYYAFSLEYAEKPTAPEYSREYGSTGGQHPEWRKNAAETVEYFQKTLSKKSVVASFDHQILWSLLLNSNVYLFNPDPQGSLVSTNEIEKRFLIYCKILGLKSDQVARLVATRSMNLRILSGGKFQFNRLHSYLPLSKYPPQALDSYHQRWNNWFLLIPPSYVQQMVKNYESLPANPLNIKANFRLPDYIVLNNYSGMKNIKISSLYQKAFQTTVFTVFAKKIQN